MDEHPRYGYGSGGHPLGSRRDRDAEVIRRVLRRTGFKDFGERHLDGFAVECANASEDGDEPFTVAYCGDREVPATVRRYERALAQTGMHVGADPEDNGMLLVARRPVARAGRTLLGVAIICAVLAAVGLVISWVASGRARLAGGIGSGVLGVVAVFLAALWYRRRLDEQELDAQRA